MISIVLPKWLFTTSPVYRVAGGEVFSGRDEAHDVQFRLELPQRLERAEHGRGAGHVELHVSMFCAGLIEMPPNRM